MVTHNRIGDLDHLANRRHIVDAHDVRAARDAEGHGRGSAEDALIGGYATQDATNEALARGANQDGLAQRAQFAQAVQQFEVVIKGLAEADAGIYDHLLAGDTCGSGNLHSRTQISNHLA